MKPTEIITFTGHYIDLLDPDPSRICIEDIAHALSNLCRFAGHTNHFYSVAQHSINLAHGPYVPDIYALEALLHDASEAYLVDIPRPLKNLLPEYVKIEKNMQIIIGTVFGLKYHTDPLVARIIDEADARILKAEFQLHFNDGNGISWLPETAERHFLEYYSNLVNKL